MKNLQKNIGQIYWIFIISLMLVGIYLINIAVWQADTFIASPFNARVNIYDSSVRRGSIYDANGNIIAQSILTNNGYERFYPLDNLFAHTAGFSGMSRAGLELSRNFEMYRLNLNLWQRISHIIFGEPLLANSIVTTFDYELQSLIYNALGNRKGAVVVMHPNTGAIMAMVSTPSFNPNYVDTLWQQLSMDTENAPLVNRATQGLYPPGSTFKIVTALAALRYDSELIDFMLYCTGTHTFGNYSINCAFGNTHGNVDMRRAMAVSCNGYFAYLAYKIGAYSLINMVESLGFTNPQVFELPNNQSSFLLEPYSNTDELIQTSIGQGRTLTNTLDMAQLMSAIANNGQKMQPFIVSHTLGRNNNILATYSPRNLGQIINADYAHIISNMLTEVVLSGTGQAAYTPGLSISGKTGTAQNATGIDHSWFVGYAISYEPIAAVAIIIESTGGGPAATQLAGDIFRFLRLTTYQ